MLVKWRREIAAWVVLAGAVIGLVASFVLSVEALVLAGNADKALSCDVNAALSCSSVARHWSASVLGFPNSFIGLMTLPVVVTIAVALLVKVKFPRWFMRAATAGAFVGLTFAGWMFYMSYVEIRILCPWCLTLDVGMVLVFFGLLNFVALDGTILPTRLSDRMKNWAGRGYIWLGMWLMLTVVAMMIIGKFGGVLF